MMKTTASASVSPDGLMQLADAEFGNMNEVNVEIHGAIEKHGIISRQKKYRDDKGRVIFEGKQVKR